MAVVCAATGRQEALLMTKWLPFDMPWDTAQAIADDAMRSISMLALGVLLGLIALVILAKVGGNWRIPLFLLFLVPTIAILGGFIK
jgi:hypothetical protein